MKLEREKSVLAGERKAVAELLKNKDVLERKEAALAERLAALRTDRAALDDERKALAAERRAADKERDEIRGAWRKIKDDTTRVEKKEKSVQRLVDAQLAAGRKSLEENQRKVRLTIVELHQRTERARGEEDRVRKLRQTTESLTEALQKKMKELKAREAEIEDRRVEVERLRRKLEGLF